MQYHARDITLSESNKKKKINKENIDEWFVSEDTRFEYALRYNDDWWWKLNETHDAMLEKIGASCCRFCEEETVDESLWANIHKKRQRIKQGSGEKMRKKGEKGAYDLTNEKSKRRTTII